MKYIRAAVFSSSGEPLSVVDKPMLNSRCISKQIVLMLGILPTILWAEPAYIPLNYGDMNPLTMNFGAPRVTSPADINQEQFSWQVTSELSNTVHMATTGSERLLIDAETTRHVMLLEYAITNNWNILLEVPYIRHGGGSLDGFIEQFHSTLGFPSGPRRGREKNAFAISYLRRGMEPLVINDVQSGMGDASIALVRELSSDWEDSLNIGLKMKFSSGKILDLTGSGTNDLAIWTSASKKLSSNVSYYLSLSAVSIGGSNGLLANIRNDEYATASYGMGWRHSELIEFKLQLDARTSIFGGSSIRALGHSIALSMGGTLHFSNGYELDIAVTEDIDVGTSPDVVFHMNFRRKY